MSLTPLRSLALMLTLFTALSAEAFNKDRCGTLFPKSDDSHPPYYAPIYVFTMFPSTTSYFSSIGACSMYGRTSSMPRAEFIEKTLLPLQVDAARGEGDYLNALAELSGCPGEQNAVFGSVMRANFRQVFGVEGSTRELEGRIDQAIQSDSGLRSVCRQI